jgi:hypothetical protein
MIRRIAIVFCAAALLVVISAADSQAARYRGSSHRGLRAQRPSAARHVAKPCVYPRVRQIDGRTLWDLGKQNGQWPRLP